MKHLESVLAEQGLTASAAARKAFISGMQELRARDGAAEAFRIITEAGKPIIALTNGSASSTMSLLETAGLLEAVDHVVSVDEVKLSKPRAEIYHRAARNAGVQPGELALIAGHAWDINGAKAAGLITAYLSSAGPFSTVMRHADVEGATLAECARALLAL